MNRMLCYLLGASLAFLGVTAHAQMGPVGPGGSQVLNLPTSPAAANPNAKRAMDGLPQQMEDTIRDPFWPIGYVPPSMQQAAGPNATGAPAEPPSRNWELAQKGLAIKGIIKAGNAYVATVNNKIVGQNETVSVYYDGQKYTWRVSSITAKSVQFQPDEAASAEKKE